MNTNHLVRIHPLPFLLFPLNISPPTSLSFSYPYITHWVQSVLPIGMLADLLVWCWTCDSSCSGFVSVIAMSGPDDIIDGTFSHLSDLTFFVLPLLKWTLVLGKGVDTNVPYRGQYSTIHCLFLTYIRYNDLLKQFQMSQLIGLLRTLQCSRCYLLLLEVCVPCQSIQKNTTFPYGLSNLQ